MSKESKAFVCGMLCMAALCSLPIVILLYALTIDSFTDGYTQGKQEGYKAGYVMALVKQKKASNTILYFSNKTTVNLCGCGAMKSEQRKRANERM